MATTWTDNDLFVAADVSAMLPARYAGITTTNYHSTVKRIFEREIESIYSDYDKFDIEEITTTSMATLKESALMMNLAIISRHQYTSADEEDPFYVEYLEYEAKAMDWMKKDINLIKDWNAPTGINDEESRYSRLSF